MQLKQRLASKRPTVGTFVKTPHYHNVEVLSRTPLEVLCLDAEHASFGRAELDSCVLAAMANQKDVIIRVQDDQPSTLLNALDIGATGVLIPHVKTAAQLQSVAQHCYFGDKGRGYAGSTRFAGYTTAGLTSNLARNKQQTCVIAQIEDLAALDELDEICQVENVDCLFIGSMDLTVALGASSAKEETVQQVMEQIVSTAKKYQRPLGMFIADLNDIGYWVDKGVSLFLLASDHSFMLSGASALYDKFQSQL